MLRAFCLFFRAFPSMNASSFLSRNNELFLFAFLGNADRLVFVCQRIKTVVVNLFRRMHCAI